MSTKAFFAIAVVSIALIGTYFGIVNTKKTTLLDDNVKFAGISSLKNDTINIIIIHGIGDHCIGYADAMISSLISKLSGKEWNNVRTGYSEYLKKVKEEVERNIFISESDSASELTSSYKIYPPRDGHCDIDKGDTETIDYLKGLDNKLVDKADELESNSDQRKTIDLESVVSGQEQLCESINDTAQNIAWDTVSCHRLSVKKSTTLLRKGEIDYGYTTGFIRRITRKITANRHLRIYEVTWNPATRWIKKSLRDLERINEKTSQHYVNREVKSVVVNTAIADAVAYLSDSGILVNVNILKAFCLTLADSQSDPLSYEFGCTKSDLQLVADKFSENNDVVLIAHSLGTRILFDTLGYLSLGTSNDDDMRESGPNLIEEIESKFKLIGAMVPVEYTNPATPDEEGFSDLLAKHIPEFIQAIRSIYVFTNQIPLLEANITSPFRPLDYDFSIGFSSFVESRLSKDPLQIVSFHDPDDLLSYNLKCWFHTTVLKQLETTKKILEDEATLRSDLYKTKFGDENRELRDALFDICSKKELKKPDDIAVYDSIWVAQDKLKLVDAAVRLNGGRIPFLVADPEGIHSNYFSDEAVHDWLLEGKY